MDISWTNRLTIGFLNGKELSVKWSKPKTLERDHHLVTIQYGEVSRDVVIDSEFSICARDLVRAMGWLDDYRPAFGDDVIEILKGPVAEYFKAWENLQRINRH